MTRELSSPFAPGQGGAGTVSAPTLMTALKVVDGAGSGIDADLVNGGEVVLSKGGIDLPPDNDISLGWTGTGVSVTVDGVDQGDLALSTDIVGINSTAAGTPLVEYISSSGYNMLSIRIEGKVFTTSGNTTSYANLGSGRGDSNTEIATGLDNLAIVTIPSTSPVVDSFTAGHISYALLANKELWVWGKQITGLLGLGHTAYVGTPTLSSTNVEEVYAHPTNGSYDINKSSLFIRKTDGNIYGAGYNDNGRLGIGNTTTQTSWVQITALGTNQVSKLWNLGNWAGCTIVLMTDGRILAAGYNGYGQLGIGNTTAQTNFVDITLAWAGVSNVLDLKVSGALGYHDGLARSRTNLIMLITLSTGNIVRTSGYNAWGQLGDGTTTQRTTPVAPLGLPTDIVDIAAVSVMTMQALSASGALYSWGHNANGQVGGSAGSSTPQLVKTNIAKLHSDGWNMHAHGYRTPVFVEDNNGRLWGAGYNGTGQLGVGNGTVSITTFTETLLPKDEQVHLMGFYAVGIDEFIVVCVTKQGNMYVWGYNVKKGVIDGGNAAQVYVPLYIRLPKLETDVNYV